MNQIEQADDAIAAKVKEVRSERQALFDTLPLDFKHTVQHIAQLSTELGELHATRHLLSYTSVDMG